MTAPRFTLADLDAASAIWGANCGPGALAAICGLTLDEVRPHMGATWPGYTNPTCMFTALRSIGVRWTWSSIMVAEQPPTWPRWGLVRIQWDGPWTQPGVPMRARYRHTHWVGAGPLYDQDGAAIAGEVCVWDVNQLVGSCDGWSPLAWWTARTVPHLTADIPRATGRWHITHAIEVERR